MVKAKESKEAKEAAKKEMETSLAPVSGQGTDGLEGLEAEDVNVPYLYLVREGAQHAVCADGKKAAPGTYFHSLEKKAYKDPEVIIAYAKKVQRNRYEDGEDTGDKETVWALLLLLGKELAPIKMTVSGYNMYSGWKDFTSKLIFEKIGSPYNVRVKLTTAEVLMVKRGKNILVNKFEVVRPTTDDEKMKASDVAMKLSSILGDAPDPEVQEDSEGYRKTVQGTEVEEFDLGLPEDSEG